MSLKNLNQIGIESQQSFLTYKKEEIKLSKEFKSLFTKIIEQDSKESVSFSEFTTIVNTSKGLTITFPNQWFYIASFFVDYLNSLKEYKAHFQKVLNNVHKDSLAEIKKTKQIPIEIKDKIDNYFETDNDVENFSKFLSDYDWWFGSKTIDRGDYFVSPILSLAKVVNVSQSYISHLAYLLSENSQLLSYLSQSVISKEVPEKINEYNDSNPINLKEKFAEWFIQQDGSKHNYFKDSFNSDKAKLIEGLSEYEDVYEEEFRSLVFSLPMENTQEYIETLEKNLYQEDGEFFRFSKKRSTHMPRAILGNKNYLKFLKEKEFSKPKIHQIDFKISKFHEDCDNSGLKFTDSLLTRYVSSLATKPFVLLSGLSGSGKTKLAEAFAKWICESEEQYALIPVGADWTNREPLLGYPNALKDNEYVKPDNDALDLLLRAKDNKDKPYFLILDEMNLSHVERYFADFLSTMESKNVIPLHKIDVEVNEIPKTIKLPNNLFIVGTVNIDETTYMFSPKVLDRANTIEFRVNENDIEDFLKEPNDVDLDKLEGLGKSMATNFVDIATKKEDYQLSADQQTEVHTFFKELQKSGAEFGYRTAFEISKLIFKLKEFGLDGENDKIDIAIMQKMLPKLHGSRTKLSRTLKPLAKLCLLSVDDDFDKKYFNNFDKIDFDKDENIKYKLSFQKIMRMYKNAVENGFASYAEA